MSDNPGPGRRARLATDPGIQGRIVAAVRSGIPLEVAAQSQGIGVSTFFSWMKRGEGETEGIYREFMEAVRQAEAEAHMALVGTVRRAAVDKGNWQAALAYMKMRWPKHYAERYEHTGANGGPIAMEIASALEGLTEDELAGIEAHLASTAGRAAEPDPSGTGTPSTD